MILYWFLLLVIAIVAYGLGSMSTLVIASNFVFRTSLRRLGRGNLFISNFRRIYGAWGAVRLLLVEAVKDSIPILLGALLLGFKGHADVGRAFAGFCLVLGRLYPLFYDFRGSHATLPLIVMGLYISPAIGAVTAVAALAGTFITRYTALGTLIAAFIFAAVAVLMVENDLILKLMVFAVALILFKHIPALSRIAGGREERLSFEEDITYKLDEKF